ncbi:MAG: DUF4836 family protein [Bacteroidales bacterium]|nr:DUF4836 family protein [Bacteroidales bacterium]
MKKTFLAAICTIFAAVALNSCIGGNADKRIADVLDAVPAEADMVGVLDIKLLMNSADIELNGSDIILPTYIKNEIPGEAMNEFEEFEEEYAETGLDISAGAMFASLSGDRERMFFVLPVRDKATFSDYMENHEEQLSETEKGVTYYYTNSSWDDQIRIECAENNGYVYFLESRRYFDNMDEAIRILQPFFAPEKSYRSTMQGALILEGNGGGFAFTMPKVLIREMRKEDVPSSISNSLEGAYFVANYTLNADKLVTTMAVYDSNNKPLSLNNIIGNEIPGLTLTSGIDSKILKYLPANTIAAYAANVEGTDWNELFDWSAETFRLSRDERGALTMVGSYLKKLGGNIAIGAGFDGGLKEVGQLINGEANPLENITFGVAIQTQPNGASDLIKELSGLLDMAEMPYEKINNGLSVSIPDLGEIYAMAIDDMIVISNEKITAAQSNPVSRTDFGEQILGCIFVVDKNNQILQDLGINYGLEMVGGYSANPLRGDGELRIIGSPDNLVTSIVKTVFDIVNNADKLYSRYFERKYEYNDYDYDYDYDYPAVEEVEEVAAIDSVAAYDYYY